MGKLVLVNKNDEVIGFEDKEKCHLDKGILHRAFTIFLFNNKGQLLLQKRSKSKMLWSLYWEASCTSHPYKGESYLKAAKRRLKEELGITSQLRLKFVDKFQYRSFFKNIGSEYEICVLYVGKYNGKIKPNLKEIADWQWIEIEKLKKEISKHPKNYAPWLKIGLEKLKNYDKKNRSLS